MDFEAFPKLSRLYRGCMVTEKLDGTNAQVVIPAGDGPMLVGSRNRWITPDSDNFGFARWALDNEAELRGLGPGQHFGEWWGAGVGRRYGLKEKRFTLFNAARWTADNTPACVSVVPILYQGPFSDAAVTECLGRLAAGGSVAAPGFMDPEGVVVYHEAARTMFKVTLGGDGHKGI